MLYGCVVVWCVVYLAMQVMRARMCSAQALLLFVVAGVCPSYVSEVGEDDDDDDIAANLVCGGRWLFGSSPSFRKRTVCIQEVPTSFTCTLDLSRANPSPGSVVAVLTVLTQPTAASSKSSSRVAAGPRHRCQKRRKTAVKPRQEAKRTARKVPRGVSQTNTYIYTCSVPVEIASIKPALPLHLAVTR